MRDEKHDQRWLFREKRPRQRWPARTAHDDVREEDVDVSALGVEDGIRLVGEA